MNQCNEIETLQYMGSKARIIPHICEPIIKKVELGHSKQGRSSTSKVDEYIFICRPQEIMHNVDEKLSVIKELKPIVNNPAGFMHNYMARKPYNVRFHVRIQSSLSYHRSYKAP